MRRPLLAAALALALPAVAGCGEEEDKRLTVSAASSLKQALDGCGPDGAAVRLATGGSDELAAQIRRGVKLDVYAAANVELPQALVREGLLRETAPFATNELVLATPSKGDVRSLEDVTRRGVRLVIGSDSVPVGSYTRRVIERLPRRQRRAVLLNVASEEPDVRGVVGKLASGAADAGFVYATDVRGAGRRLRRIELPTRLRPEVVLAAGRVTGAKEPTLASRYLIGLREGSCAARLRRAGFGPPP